jgi:hypothetical protein
MNDNHWQPQPGQPLPDNSVTAPAPAGEALSAFAFRKDPSVPASSATASPATPRQGSVSGVVEMGGQDGRPGVQWVRLSDVIAARTAGWSGKGIDLSQRFSSRARSVGIKGAKASGRTVASAGRATGRAAGRAGQGAWDRARALPPVWAFGRGGRSGQQTPVTRSGIARGR